jgi:predicted RND superfamily exporter protein
MKKVIDWVIHHRLPLFIFFIIAAIVSGIAMTKVNVNYSLQDYLPADVPSSQAIEVLDDEFGFTVPNMRAVFPVDNLQEALEIKEKLKAQDEIEEVLWLDDSIDLYMPLALQDQDTIEAFYKNGYALYQIVGDTVNAKHTLDTVYALAPDVKVDGYVVDLANAQVSVQSEMASVALIIVPLVLLVLALSTHSWLEPLIFGATIGVGILLNMGTNIFLDSVSFITQSVASVLQLAVCMDYAIFLLNNFNRNRKQGMEAEAAMALAMEQSMKAVASSALTTLFGFLALLFMRFGIGANLGIVMAKGIFFSFVAVIFFMPTFLLAVYPWVDKTTHRSFMPNFTNLGRFVHRAKWVILVVVLIVLIPAFKGSRANSFIYGMGAYPEGTRIAEDTAFIENHYGLQQQMSLLVDRHDIPAQLKIQKALEEQPEVKSIISYVCMVDPAIPPEVIQSDRLDMLLSENYSQMIIMVQSAAEGDEAFDLVERIRAIADDATGGHYYLTGHNVVMYDMKTTIKADDPIVNGLAVLAILVVIALAFKSLSLAVLLVFTIEVAIWINLGVPYFMGDSLSYIGYLIISTVQLGATVDYAILYTEHYLQLRRRMNKRESIIEAAHEVVPSILPPALILTIAGFALRKTSSLHIVSELGLVLGRGTILSFFMVILLLPAMLYVFDYVIQKTSYKLKLAPSKEERGEKND